MYGLNVVNILAEALIAGSGSFGSGHYLKDFAFVNWQSRVLPILTTSPWSLSIDHLLIQNCAFLDQSFNFRDNPATGELSTVRNATIQNNTFQLLRFMNTGNDAPRDSTNRITNNTFIQGTNWNDLPTSSLQDPSTRNRTWPQNFGDAEICLWKDDKVGAVSITIDDNNAPDHAWWIEQGNTYGFRFTWFVITNYLKESPYSGGQFGGWDDFKKIIGLGHDVQSHSANHLGSTLTLDEEYRLSKNAIEAHFPGHRVLALAFPGNPSSPLKNDPELAKLYYVGARGTTGLHNPAKSINYLNTNSINQFYFETDHWASINNMLVYNSEHTNSYRAWQCMHFHGISSFKDNIIQGLNYIKTRENDFWVALFRDVILYGQERDTSQLIPIAATTDRLVFNLTDKRDNSIFNYPLTVKVRLDDSWGNVFATQGGQAIASRMISNEVGRYALVQALPDAGAIILQKQEAASNSENTNQPSGLHLNKTAFNPARSEVINIEYTGHPGDAIRISIFDRKGNEVKLLLDSTQSGSTPLSASWDGRNASGTIVSSGVYILELKAGDTIEKKKVVVIK